MPRHDDDLQRLRAQLQGKTDESKADPTGDPLMDAPTPVDDDPTLTAPSPRRASIPPPSRLATPPRTPMTSSPAAPARPSEGTPIEAIPTEQEIDAASSKALAKVPPKAPPKVPPKAPTKVPKTPTIAPTIAPSAAKALRETLTGPAQIVSSRERGDPSESTITLGVDDVELLASSPAITNGLPATPPLPPPRPPAGPPMVPGMRGTLPFGALLPEASAEYRSVTNEDDTKVDTSDDADPTVPHQLTAPLTPAPRAAPSAIIASAERTTASGLIATASEVGLLLPPTLDADWDWAPPPDAGSEPSYAEEPPRPLFDGADPRLVPPLDTVASYSKEAMALGAAQPERAAAMWLEAARAALRETADGATVERLLAKAANQAPASAALTAQLRRIHLRRRDWRALAAASQRQVELGGPVASRVAVLIEAAAVERFERGDRKTALTLLHRALDLLPSDTMTLSMAAALHLELDEAPAAVERLEQLTETLSAPEERARCLYTIGALFESRLQKPQRAIEAYGRAIEADARHTPALVALCELHEMQGEWAALARRLEQLAELEPDAAAAPLARAGALHLDRSGDLDAAVRVLMAAAEHAPQDPAPLLRLAHALEARGSYAELEATLRRLDRLTFDADSRAALRTRIGGLAETHLRDPERAIEAYEDALRAVPDYLPALQALGTLYRRRERPDKLLALLTPETEDDSSSALRAERCLEAALLLDGELAQPDEAQNFYQRALELSPGHAVAFWRLRRLLTRLDKHAELAELLARQVEQTADIKTRHHLLLELARLQAFALQQPEAATATYSLARKVEVNRSPAIELADLFEREGRWPELVELLIEEARDTRDPAEAQGHRLRAAMVLEHELDEPERALALLERVLAADPSELGALRAAGRIHHRLGRWNDLVALYQHELERCGGDDEAAALLCRIGRVQDELIGEPTAAITTYLQALERQPKNGAALAALERMVRLEERHKDLIDVLRRHAQAAKDPQQAADALCRAAELADSHLNDPRRALSLVNEALSRATTHATALHAKLGLQLRRGQHDEARQTLRSLLGAALSERQRALLTLRLARHEELRLGPSNDEELREQLRASPYAEQLRSELLRFDRLAGRADLSETLVEMAQRTLDPTLAASLFLEAAQRAELIDADDEQHLNCASQAFACREDAPPVVWALERALERLGQHVELAALYEHEAGTEGEFAVRIPILADAAVAYLEAGDPTEAARVARQCLSGDRHHLPSLLLVARLAEERQSWNELAATADQIAEACRNPDNRLRAALIASDTWASQVSDRGRALSSLQPALTDDPGQVDAFARSERLLAQTEDYTQLSRLYARRINVCTDVRQKVELLRLNARLLRDRLGDSARAISEFAQLLALAPRDIDALFEQAALLCRHHRWSDAVATLGTLVETAEDAPVRRDARLRQARLWLDQLHEPRRARAVLEQALAEEKQDDGARKLLVEAYLAESEWQSARSLLEVLAARPGEAALGLRVWAFARLAEVARTGLRDDALRERSELSALSQAAGQAALLDDLVSGFVERGEVERLRGLIMTLVNRTPAPETLVLLRTALGRVLLSAGQARAAFEQLRDALIGDPDHQEARLLRARAQEALGEGAAAAAAYRSLLTDDISCHEAARGLVRVVGPLGQPAVVAAAGALLELAGVATAEDIEHVESFDRGGGPNGSLAWRDLALSPEDEEEETASRPFAALEELLLPLLPHLDTVFKTPLAAAVGASHPAASAATRIANALGLPSVQLSIETTDPPAHAGIGHPVPLRISPELAALPDEAPFRFWVGRALGAAATAGALLEQLDDEQLDGMFEALEDPKPLASHVTQHRKQLLRALPRKVRKQLEQHEPTRPPRDRWRLYRSLERRRADRVGLLVSSNPRIAFGQLEDSDGARLNSLVRFALSEDFDRLYRRLWNATEG